MPNKIPACTINSYHNKNGGEQYEKEKDKDLEYFIKSENEEEKEKMNSNIEENFNFTFSNFNESERENCSNVINNEQGQAETTKVEKYEKKYILFDKKDVFEGKIDKNNKIMSFNNVFKALKKNEDKAKFKTNNEDDGDNINNTTFLAVGEKEKKNNMVTQGIIKKKIGFIKLKEWEEERQARFADFFIITNAVYLELFSVVEEGCNSTSLIINFYKELVRSGFEYSRNLKSICICNKHKKDFSTLSPLSSASFSSTSFSRSSVSNEKQSMYKSCTNVNNSNVSLNSYNNFSIKKGNNNSEEIDSNNTCNSIFLFKEEKDKKEIKKNKMRDILFKGSKESNCFGYNFLLNFNHLLYSKIDELNQNIQNFIFNDGKLQNLMTEFESYSTICLETIKKHCLYVTKAMEMCKKNWNEYETIFKDIEKANFHHDDKKNTRRYFQCCWLTERKYVLSALNAQKAHRKYFSVLVRNVIELQKLENWRLFVLFNFLDFFVNKNCAFLRQIEDSLSILKKKFTNMINQREEERKEIVSDKTNCHNDCKVYNNLFNNEIYKSNISNNSINDLFLKKTLEERIIDNANYNQNIFTFKYLGSIFENMENEEEKNTHNCNNNKSLNENINFTNTVEEEDKRHNKYSIDEFDTTISKTFLTELEEEGISPIPSFLYTKKFLKCINFLFSSKIPNSELVVRKGYVKKLNGIGFFGKWISVFIVLTWDRFLHIFKNEEDIIPMNSICLANMEARYLEEKIKEETENFIEIRRKKKSISGFVGGRNLQIKCNTSEETNKWMFYIEMAVKGIFFCCNTSLLEKKIETETKENQIIIEAAQLKTDVHNNSYNTAFPSNKHRNSYQNQEGENDQVSNINNQTDIIFFKPHYRFPASRNLRINPFYESDNDTFNNKN